MDLRRRADFNILQVTGEPITYRDRVVSVNRERRYRGKTQISHAIGQFQRRKARGKNAEKVLADLRKSLAREIERHGEDSEKAQKLRLVIGQHLEVMGRWNEVLTERTELLDSLKRKPGEESPEFAIVLRLYALDLVAIGLPDVGRDVMKRSVDLHALTLGSEHGATERARVDLHAIESKMTNGG